MADSDEGDSEPEKPKRPVLLTLSGLCSPEAISQIVADSQRNLYVSTDWSLRFYLTAAWHGFISVAYEPEGGAPLLLPEMQFSYAALRFDQLHVSRKAAKRSRRYRLRIDGDLDGVLAGVTASHESSWLIEPYANILRCLARRPTAVPIEGGGQLKVHSVELLDAESGELVAGEVGYSTGAVYTSLTGFFDRTSRREPPQGSHAPPTAPTAATEEAAAAGAAESGAAEPAAASCAGSEETCRSQLAHDGAGTVQLVALGALLRRCGFRFWNLGHPPRRASAGREAVMMYKAELGARVLKRSAFLEEWRRARAEVPATPLGGALPPEGEPAAALVASVNQSNF